MCPTRGAGPCNQSDSAAIGSSASPDHRAVLIRTATRTWVVKADDDLRPMIRLKEEALTAWMMGASYYSLHPGFGLHAPVGNAGSDA